MKYCDLSEKKYFPITVNIFPCQKSEISEVFILSLDKNTMRFCNGSGVHQGIYPLYFMFLSSNLLTQIHIDNGDQNVYMSLMICVLNYYVFLYKTSH